MTTTIGDRETGNKSKPSRRLGYVVAIAVNAVFLYVVNHLLTWEWPPFITADLDDVLPLISLSVAATISANVVWLVFDPQWFRSAAQIVLNVISVIVTVRVWQVFPFDFSTYSFDWEIVARGLLVLTFVGLVAATIAETVKLAGYLVKLRAG